MVVALAALATLTAEAPARAGAFLEVMGAPSSRHPYTARIMPAGPASAYFNPSLLLEQSGSLIIAPYGVFEETTLTYDARTADMDVPSGTPGALATSALPRSRGSESTKQGRFYMGQATSTVIVPGYLAAGFYLLLSGDAFSHNQPFFADEREQFFSNSLHYELLGDRMETVEFAFGLAFRPYVRWLSVGAGIALSFGSTTEVEVHASRTAQPSQAIIRPSSAADIKLTPHVALAVHPLDPLTITSTVHLAMGSSGEATARVGTASQTAGGLGADTLDEQTYVAEYRQGYLPLRVGLGAAWTEEPEGDLGWTAAATLLWTQWSDYIDRMGERPAQRWSDTVSVAVGGDLRYGGHFWGLDLTYVPSAVPDQTGRSSYVDNDRLGVSVGYEALVDLGGVKLYLGLQVQAQALLARHVTKSAGAAHPVIDEVPETAAIETNSPGYPGYTSGGWLVGLGGYIRIPL